MSRFRLSKTKQLNETEINEIRIFSTNRHGRVVFCNKTETANEFCKIS